LIIGLNKWDGLSLDQKETVKRQLDLKLSFLDFAEKHPISALHGSGVGKLFDVIHTLYASAMLDMSTPMLTRILKEATDAHQPPLVDNRRIKLKYAHQGGRNPPTVVIHGVQTDALPNSYKRYLINYYRAQLDLKGTPIRLEFKSPENPFHGKKNKLTERQQQKRKRLIKHHQKK
jgi:GTP-binding protein